MNLVVGYAIGRLGLFGMEPLRGSVAVCDLGCALVLLSFGLMVFVEGDQADGPSGSDSESFRAKYSRWREEHARRRPSVIEAAGTVLVSCAAV